MAKPLLLERDLSSVPTNGSLLVSIGTIVAEAATHAARCGAGEGLALTVIGLFAVVMGRGGGGGGTLTFRRGVERRASF